VTAKPWPPDVLAVVTVPALLSVATVARLLDCSQTVRRRIYAGDLPALNDHGRLMVRGDELRDYVERRDGTHTLYVLAGGDRVKIGVAKDFSKRLRALQAASPMMLEPVRLLRTNRPFRIEAALHAEFAAHRCHGEWFTAEPVLARLALMPDREILHLWEDS
jgi:hypothetical protein